MTMKERPKLGRGLQDVSSYFLTREPARDHEPEENLSPAGSKRSVCVCFPAFRPAQSAIVTNIALELARHRYGVVIEDFSEDPSERTADLMGTILSRGDGEQGDSRVRLYGLPDIIIREKAVKGPGNKPSAPGPDMKADDVFPAGFMLVNPPPSLGFLLEAEQAGDYIVIAKTDENSLLQCYAYIKVIHARSPSSRVHVVFDHAGSIGGLEAVFQKFAHFIQDNMGFAVDFFGTLSRDGHFEQSMAEKRPLVLAGIHSAAKDALIRICSLLLEVHRDQDRNCEE